MEMGFNFNQNIHRIGKKNSDMTEELSRFRKQLNDLYLQQFRCFPYHYFRQGMLLNIKRLE